MSEVEGLWVNYHVPLLKHALLDLCEVDTEPGMVEIERRTAVVEIAIVAGGSHGDPEGKARDFGSHAVVDEISTTCQAREDRICRIIRRVLYCAMAST
jgi:hypothetical protein